MIYVTGIFVQHVRANCHFFFHTGFIVKGLGNDNDEVEVKEFSDEVYWETAEDFGLSIEEKSKA